MLEIGAYTFDPPKLSNLTFGTNFVAGYTGYYYVEIPPNYRSSKLSDVFYCGDSPNISLNSSKLPPPDPLTSPPPPILPRLII